MVDVLPRSAWTTSANGRAGRSLNPSSVEGVGLHYPAAGNVTYAGRTRDQIAALLRGWRDLHRRAPRGWVDIGYNFAFDQDGRVWDLTGYNVGAHAGTHGNPRYVGCLLILGDNEQPSAKMIAAIRAFRTENVLRRYPKATVIRGHQQIPGNSTACPGKPVMALIRSGQLTAATPKPDPTPTPKPTPTKRRKWFSVLAWNLAVSNDHGRKTWTTRFPKIVKAIGSHYSRDVLLFTEAWAKDHDATARRLLQGVGYKVAVYFAGRAVVVRDSIKVGRTDTFTMRETGPAKDSRHAVAAEIFPDGSAALAVVSHLEHRDGPAYDLVRVAQAKEVREWAEGLAKKWGLPLDRIVFYLDENSATWVSDRAFGSTWPDAADHADSYGAKSTSTFVGWTGRVSTNGYRPDKVRTHKSRPVSRASTSPTFPELSDHLPVLAVLDRVRKESA